MTAPTPGPWTVAPGQRGAGEEAYYEVGTEDGSLASIARLYFDPRLREERTVALADATLVAAAPALLDALERVMPLPADCPRCARVGDLCIAHAAIAKARGAK